MQGDDILARPQDEQGAQLAQAQRRGCSAGLLAGCRRWCRTSFVCLWACSRRLRWGGVTMHGVGWLEVGGREPGRGPAWAITAHGCDLRPTFSPASSSYSPQSSTLQGPGLVGGHDLHLSSDPSSLASSSAPPQHCHVSPRCLRLPIVRCDPLPSLGAACPHVCSPVIRAPSCIAAMRSRSGGPCSAALIHAHLEQESSNLMPSRCTDILTRHHIVKKDCRGCPMHRPPCFHFLTHGASTVSGHRQMYYWGQNDYMPKKLF